MRTQAPHKQGGGMMFIHCPKDGPILRWLLHTSYAAERKGGTSGKPVAKLIGCPAL